MSIVHQTVSYEIENPELFRGEGGGGYQKLTKKQPIETSTESML